MNGLIQNGPLECLAALAIIHFIADFPLQGDYLARNKVRSTAGSHSEWLVALCAHSAIHAGGVWIITGSSMLASVELILHGLIDLAKGERKLSLLADQALHLCCKAGYVLALLG